MLDVYKTIHIELVRTGYEHSSLGQELRVHADGHDTGVEIWSNDLRDPRVVLTAKALGLLVAT